MSAPPLSVAAYPPPPPMTFFGIRKVRCQVGRRTAGVCLDAWIFDNRLVEVNDDLRNQRQDPAIIFTGVPAVGLIAEMPFAGEIGRVAVLHTKGPRGASRTGAQVFRDVAGPP